LGYQIDRPIRDARLEVVLGRARQVDDPIVPPARVRVAGASAHHGDVEVCGVHGIAERDDALRPEDLLDIAGVALGAVAHDDLVGRELDAALAVVVADDRVDEKIPAGLGRVAAEGLRPGHLVDGLVHRADHGVGQGSGHVADPQTDELRVRVRGLVFTSAPAGLTEEVAGAKLQVVVVYPGHGGRF